MLAVIRELVDQNSYSGNPEGGARVADLLAQRLGAIKGISVQSFASQRFAPHLMACSEAARESADGCIALIGHHDTVFPPGSFEGFSREGDVARGPGVLDMKSGLTLMVFALQALADRGYLNELPIRLISVSSMVKPAMAAITSRMPWTFCMGCLSVLWRDAARDRL